MKNLYSFINQPIHTVTLEQFCSMDDYDVLMAIKEWSKNKDVVLSTLCRGILDRHLLKVKYFKDPVGEEMLDEKVAEISKKINISIDDAHWLAFKGEAASSTYNFENEHIHILFKDGSIKDISEVDNALINENLRGTVKKYYICYLR